MAFDAHRGDASEGHEHHRLGRGIEPEFQKQAFDRFQSRPVPGGFRAQCEYAVWATNGPLPPPVAGCGVYPGFLQASVTQDDKHHQTGKPVSIMRELVRVVRRDGVLLDPFAGSGSTGVAALLEGRRVILCERVPEYAAVARARLADAAEVLPTPRGLQLTLGGAR